MGIFVRRVNNFPPLLVHSELTVLNKKEESTLENGHVQLNKNLNFYITRCSPGNILLKQLAVPLCSRLPLQ